jgi:hypothetical protein
MLVALKSKETIISVQKPKKELMLKMLNLKKKELTTLEESTLSKKLIIMICK